MAKVIVDALRCEGAKKCVKACPEKVFRMEKAPTSLPIIVLAKVFVHGGRQAVVANEAACTGCMKCVEACPEDAISVIADAEAVQLSSARSTGFRAARRA
jgi:NAD-dependent dihydropyrimidine dehydrogenase PreA subunit